MGLSCSNNKRFQKVLNRIARQFRNTILEAKILKLEYILNEIIRMALPKAIVINSKLHNRTLYRSVVTETVMADRTIIQSSSIIKCFILGRDIVTILCHLKHQAAPAVLFARNEHI